MEKKYRHEYKYKITAAEMAVLDMRAAMLLHTDSHVDGEGTYLIKSLYFDDYGDSCYWENEDGYNVRAKYRIRYYNNDTECIRLEKKSKVNGMTHKDSCVISKQQCQEFMKGKVPMMTPDMPPMMQKLFTEMRLKNLLPKVIVIYERKPYVYGIGNVRVTFDRNILSSNAISEFLSETITARPIMQKGESILEVKWDELLPDYIRTHLELDSLQWTSFSKYYLCRKYDCYGGLNL